MTLLEYVVNVRPRRGIILMHVNSRVQFLHHPSFEGSLIDLKTFFRRSLTSTPRCRNAKKMKTSSLDIAHKRDKISDRIKLNTNLTVRRHGASY